LKTVFLKKEVMFRSRHVHRSHSGLCFLGVFRKHIYLHRLGLPWIQFIRTQRLCFVYMFWCMKVGIISTGMCIRVLSLSVLFPPWLLC